MKLLMVSLDRKIFEDGSPVQKRMLELGSIFEELHIIVYAEKRVGLTSRKLGENIWLYPTNATSRYLHPLKAVRIARRDIAKQGILPADIISAQDAAETGLAAWRIARIFSLPLHLQDHADVCDPAFIRESFSNRLRSTLARFLLPKANGIRVVSENSKRRLLARLPHLGKRIVVLPVYVDLEGFATPAMFTLTERYPQFTHRLLMACRLVPQKDIPLAFGVLINLLKTHPRAGLILVGEGNDQAALVRLAASMGIEDNLVFEPWQKDLVSYYKTADVFLMTSLYESYGRTLFEAAACGLPFVSTDVGIASSLIELGVRGVVSKDRDATHMSAFCAEVLNESHDRDEIQKKNMILLNAFQGGSIAEYLSRYQTMMELAQKPNVP